MYALLLCFQGSFISRSLVCVAVVAAAGWLLILLFVVAECLQSLEQQAQRVGAGGRGRGGQQQQQQQKSDECVRGVVATMK
jgi:hypothetical protein